MMGMQEDGEGIYFCFQLKCVSLLTAAGISGAIARKCVLEWKDQP